MNRKDGISIAETRSRLAADRTRLREFLAERPHLPIGPLFLIPSYQAVFLHRWSHYFFRRGNRWIARLLWHFNLLVTGADISPLVDIDGGLVIVYPVCVIMVGKAGRNLTVIGNGGFGGGISAEDVGAGPGLPVLGDNVWLDLGAVVLGSVRIGSNVRIQTRALVTSDVPDGAVVERTASRVRRGTAEAEMKETVVQ